MTGLAELLSYEFVRNAAWAGLLGAVLCGVVGTFVVVKRLVFISGGISHAAFGGLGVCYFLGLDPRLGAAVVAVLAALLLARSGKGRGRSHDATIGVLWAAGMAIGFLFMHQTPGYAPNLMTYLFGNILTVGTSDVLLTLGLTLAVVGALWLWFDELVAVAFDEEFAAVQGVRVRTVNALLLVAIALSVVFLLRLVGIVLVIALLTIPPVIGLRLAKGFLQVVLLAVGSGVAMALGGLSLSYAYDLPSGPAIVLLGAAGLGVIGLAGRWRGRRRAAGGRGLAAAAAGSTVDPP
ncbi:MAG TPA: metal ABC transporter permease [Thermoanaerobaculia bacterium]|nr:metal ABC transporter permease [Thermoanaerobaculia bacterium]